MHGGDSMKGWQDWFAYGLAVISLLFLAMIVAMPM
jgi:hypothetical protein